MIDAIDKLRAALVARAGGDVILDPVVERALEDIRTSVGGPVSPIRTWYVSGTEWYTAGVVTAATAMDAARSYRELLNLEGNANDHEDEVDDRVDRSTFEVVPIKDPFTSSSWGGSYAVANDDLNDLWDWDALETVKLEEGA